MFERIDILINRVIAIEDYSGLCFKCLQRKDVTTYSIYGRGYGSWFDNFNTKLQLCDDCKPEGINDWFNENPTIDDYSEEYKYEQNIYDFIDTLPIEGRELFRGRCASGACAGYMSGQDWIDYELDIMPEWKIREYGYYVPYRLKVAKERFELCNEPVNKIWSDGSKSCYCPFGAHGDWGQKAGRNFGETCYTCEHFCQRYEQIKEMADNKYDKYAKIRAAKALLEREHDLVEEYESESENQ